MKSKLLITCLVLSTFLSFSQESTRFESLKNNKAKLDVDWMFSPMIDISGTSEEFKIFAGGGAAAIFNDNFFAGVYFSSAIGGLNPAGYDDPEEWKNYFEYGGVWAGYRFNPDKLIHGILDIKTGFGNLALGEDLGADWINQSVYVFKPALEMEFNLNKRLRLGFDIHYRYISPVPLYLNDYAYLSGPGLGLTFKYVR
jgi:hypothetical protein